MSEIDKTARQLLRPNRTSADIDFAVEYIVSRVTALRRIVAKTVTSSTSARAAAEEICRYFGDAELAMGGAVNLNGVTAIIQRHFLSHEEP